ncbi:MAG: hypothetical protein EOO16_24005 [Chitinophagaceae bacterium]|nr:MAG: hypothetical protein EOO16_24005 [Chitinophagaceae bacterium]
MTATKQQVRLHFTDLSLLRQFKLYVLAYDIQVQAAHADPEANSGWIDCSLSEEEQSRALRQYGASLD